MSQRLRVQVEIVAVKKGCTKKQDDIVKIVNRNRLYTTIQLSNPVLNGQTVVINFKI